MESVSCPLCGLNITLFNLRQRDEHVNKCLEAPQNPDSPDYIKVEPEPVRVSLPGIKQEIQVKNQPSGLEPAQSNQHNIQLDQHGPLQHNSGPDPNPPTKRSLLKFKEINTDPVSKTTQTPAKKPRAVRKPPFYKILEFGVTKLAVDGFSYGDLNVDAYFLTHFHSDHYGGLGKSWSHGDIYCTPSTARLVASKLKVQQQYLHEIEINRQYTIHGQQVRVLDANHCPGAAIFLFNNTVLHTGDFRANDTLLANVKQYTTFLSNLYLDTTYLDPMRTFPSQKLVVDACSQLCRETQGKPPTRSFFTASRPRRVLVMVGTYTIGKEKLAIEIAQALSTKIWAAPEKLRILGLLGDSTLDALIEHTNGLNCQVHLVNMRDLSIQKLEQQWRYLGKHYTELMAFSPTGWTHSNRKPFSIESMKTNAIVRPGIQVFRVPYSEHSSCSELEKFCTEIKCRKIIPTVSTKHAELLKAWQVKNE